MSPSTPTIHFGLLEGLLAALQDAIQAGKNIRGIHISTYFDSQTGAAGEKITRVRLVTTSLTTDEQGAFPQYGLWVYHLASHSEVHGRSLWTWSGEDSDRLAREAVEVVADIIKHEVGVAPQQGSIYCVPLEWLAVGGGTSLFDLAVLKELVQPPEGMRSRRVSAPGAALVLGEIHGGHFAELAISDLAGDERISLVSPDLLHYYLLYPDGYDRAIAARPEAVEGPSDYQLLYDPQKGWLDPPQLLPG